MRSGVTHYPMSCHGCFVGCGEMTPSRLQPMTRQTLHISRLWRGMILARLRPYPWGAPPTKINRMAVWRRRPGSIQVAQRLLDFRYYWEATATKIIRMAVWRRRPGSIQVAQRLLDFRYYWEATARPFEWTFTRDDLKNPLDKFEQQGTLR